MAAEPFPPLTAAEEALLRRLQPLTTANVVMRARIDATPSEVSALLPSFVDPRCYNKAAGLKFLVPQADGCGTTFTAMTAEGGNLTLLGNPGETQAMTNRCVLANFLTATLGRPVAISNVCNSNTLAVLMMPCPLDIEALSRDPRVPTLHQPELISLCTVVVQLEARPPLNRAAEVTCNVWHTGAVNLMGSVLPQLQEAAFRLAEVLVRFSLPGCQPCPPGYRDPEGDEPAHLRRPQPPGAGAAGPRLPGSRKSGVVWRTALARRWRLPLTLVYARHRRGGLVRALLDATADGDRDSRLPAPRCTRRFPPAAADDDG